MAIPTNMQYFNELLGEQLGGGGGGGSSDFSTAQVTVSLSSLGQVVFLPNTIDDEGYEAVYSDIQGSGTYNVVLYKGRCVGTVNLGGVQVSATGNIEIDGTAITVTGDGTITVTA